MRINSNLSIKELLSLEGKTVILPKNDGSWSSHFRGKQPKNVEYPLTVRLEEVEHVKGNGIHHIAALGMSTDGKNRYGLTLGSYEYITLIGEDYSIWN